MFKVCITCLGCKNEVDVMGIPTWYFHTVNCNTIRSFDRFDYHYVRIDVFNKHIYDINPADTWDSSLIYDMYLLF